MSDDQSKSADYFNGLSATYADSIRNSDFKANLVVLFVAIMMGPVLAGRDHYPHYLPLPAIMAPFLLAFLSLLFCVYPRYPHGAKGATLISRRPSPADFALLEAEEQDLETLKSRCAMLSRILYWKTALLLFSVYLCLAAMVVIFVLLALSLTQRGV